MTEGCSKLPDQLSKGEAALAEIESGPLKIWESCCSLVSLVVNPALTALSSAYLIALNDHLLKFQFPYYHLLL